MREMPTDVVIEDALVEIFARPEFQTSEGFWVRIAGIVQTWLSRLNLSLGFDTSWPMLIITGLILLLAIAALLSLSVRFIMPFLGNKGKVTDIRHQTDDLLTIQSARERAATAADRDDYREAVRYLFVYLLLCLSARGQVKWSESRTNGQYLMEMAANEFSDITLVRGIMEEYNAVIYGGRTMDDGGWKNWRARVEDLALGEGL